MEGGGGGGGRGLNDKNRCFVVARISYFTSGALGKIFGRRKARVLTEQ
jgi:hypothetical protein